MWHLSRTSLTNIVGEGGGGQSTFIFVSAHVYCMCMCGPSVWPPTSVNMMRPTRKETRLTANRKSSRRFLRRNTSGYMSTTAVTRLSTHTNWRSSTEEKKRTRSIINHCFMEKKGSKLTLTFYFTWLSSPRKTIMMKKRAAQRGEKGIMVTARG